MTTAIDQRRRDAGEHRSPAEHRRQATEAAQPCHKGSGGASGSSAVPAALATRSPAMAQAVELARLVCTSSLPVLLTGESGTGKEVMARAMHEMSARASQPFVAANVAAIPEALFEAELFGAEAGAYTGLDRRRVGLLERAGCGTVLLDEIGELALPLQAKLLRVLQEGEFTPLGTDKALPVQAAILAATNRDLAQRVEDKVFRQDLYYRLAVLEIPLPPLRQRVEDLPGLTDTLLEKATEEAGCPRTSGVTAGGRQALARHDWPGNIRELRNLTQRLALRAQGAWIGEAMVRRELGGSAEGGPEGALRGEVISIGLPGCETASGVSTAGGSPAVQEVLPMAEVLQAAVRIAVELEGGDVDGAARRLGISRATVYRRLKLAAGSSSRAEVSR